MCSKFVYINVALLFLLNTGYGDISNNKVENTSARPCPCTCGIFLSSALEKGSKQPPKGNPVIIQEMDNHFMNTALGNKQCVHKCLELILKHMTKSSDIICGSVDHDIYKEKAYLFIKNYGSEWHNSNLGAGKEFCCKDNEPYKCPLIASL